MPALGETTIGDLLRDARHALAAAPFESSIREAALLLAHVLDRGEATVLAYPEQAVPEDAASRFKTLLERRLRGEPVAYLFGEREFFGRPVHVDRRVLIPRPETEHLIEAAVALDLPAAPRIVDVGTGSGAIAVTLALEIPGSHVLANDTSLPALRVAGFNARRHGVEGRIALANADLADAVRLEEIDLLVSNPPYVELADAGELSTEVRDFEPHAALFAPGSGHSVLQRLIEESTLRPGAHMIVEIGHDQGDWLRSVAVAADGWRLVDLVRDLASIPRTAVLQRQRV